MHSSRAGRLQLVISFHHVLLDGWSVSIVFRDAAAFYEAYCLGANRSSSRPVRSRTTSPGCSSRISPKQSRSGVECWTSSKGPAPISADRAPGKLPEPGEPYASQQATLSKGTTAALQGIARTHQLTLNNIVQAHGPCFLSRYTANEDIVFGATASGRPVELKGIDRWWVCPSTRCRFECGWIPASCSYPGSRVFRRYSLKPAQFEHTPLVDVQGWSGVARGTPLFETIVGFENYPVLSASQSETGAVTLGDVFERTNYPLSLIVSPAPS